MKLVRFADVTAWTSSVHDHLLLNEPENNLIFGVANQISRGLHNDRKDPYLAALETGPTVVGAALQTPPEKLLLSFALPERGCSVVAADLIRESVRVPGVLAERRLASAFAAAWSDLSGCRYDLGIRERIFSATSVGYWPRVPGKFRRAVEQDRPLLETWIAEFLNEALSQETDPQIIERSVETGLQFNEGGLFVWDHQGPVSMARHEGPTPNGIRLSAVYTPPAERGHGYASACVGHLTKRLLDSGRKFVFLFTDLSNPTSNRIYSRLGFSPVCDMDEYLFAAGRS